MPSPWPIYFPTRIVNCWALPRSPERQNKRASLASVVCKAAGKDIPIYPGAEHPMQGEQRQPIAQQAAALPAWPHETLFPINQAVDFLANTIRTHPGEVTLLTIGPLTNAGLLFYTFPDVAELLKGFVMMGGNFGEHTANERGRMEYCRRSTCIADHL